EHELRRALEHGFGPAELEVVRADRLHTLSAAVEREHTQRSEDLVEEILDAAGNRIVPLSAAAERALLEPTARALTPQDCVAAVRGAWSGGGLALTTMGSLALGPDAARRLEAAWSESLRAPVEEELAVPVAEFAYPPAVDASHVIADSEPIPE